MTLESDLNICIFLNISHTQVITIVAYVIKRDELQRFIYVKFWLSWSILLHDCMFSCLTLSGKSSVVDILPITLFNVGHTHTDEECFWVIMMAKWYPRTNVA